MLCPSENLIAAFVEGTLSAEESTTLSDHLAGCQSCRDLVDAVRQSAGVAATVGGSSPSSEPQRPNDPWAGQVLADTYQLLFPIGAGGMGSVYEAKHLRLNRRVAVKILSAQLREHADAFDRFRREAQTCASLGSRHIVDVLDFNHAPDGTPFIVMELLEGEDLAQRICFEGPLAPPMAASIGRQICAALVAAHEEGILHRDLKPSNIFLCRDDDGDRDGEPFVKVLDFGIAKARGSLATLTASREILGTPFYMSPEMANAQHRLLDHRSDLFSLGCILYEALCGTRPFDDEAIPAVLYQVVHETPPPPRALRSEIPASLSKLVMQLLQKERSDRPDSARKVGLALARSVGLPTGSGLREPTDTRGWRVSPTGQLLPPSQPRRVSALLLLGAAIVILCATGWWFLREPSSPMSVPRHSVPRHSVPAAATQSVDSPSSATTSHARQQTDALGLEADAEPSETPSSIRAGDPRRRRPANSKAGARPTRPKRKGHSKVRKVPPDTDPLL